MSETITETIERAEREGLFLWHDSRARSPREMRRVVRNGWTVDFLMTVEPIQTAINYDLEAERYEEHARSARDEASRIRHEMSRRSAVPLATAPTNSDSHQRRGEDNERD